MLERTRAQVLGEPEARLLGVRLSLLALTRIHGGRDVLAWALCAWGASSAGS